MLRQAVEACLHRAYTSYLSHGSRPDTITALGFKHKTVGQLQHEDYFPGRHAKGLVDSVQGGTWYGRDRIHQGHDLLSQSTSTAAAQKRGFINGKSE